MINLIEQTQSTNLPSVLQTTKITIPQPFRTTNNSIQPTQVRLRRRHPHLGTILHAGQNLSIETDLNHMWTNL